MALIIRRASLALLLICSASGFADEALPPGIATVELGAGRLYVNADGLALYTFKRDAEQPGKSLCNFGCQELWPPVIALNEAAPIGDWSVVKRDDGSMQWAHQGSPVYTNARDVHTDSLVGEKSGLWDVLIDPLATPPGINILGTLAGQTLVDLDGRTLYWHVGGSCSGTCLKGRQPLEAPWIAQPPGAAWSVAERADGLGQWAYQERALFAYAGDYRPGESNGEDAASGWQAAVVQNAPAIPDWVTFQETDMGPVLATADRMTLYYLPADPEQVRRETCNDECFAANWTRVIAPTDAQPIGNWSVIETADGMRHWHYLGLPVFTYNHDQIPGDTRGDKFASGAAIRGGWQAILKDTLIQKIF